MKLPDVIDPLLFLAIDNCFCSKRWTRPCDWMPLIRTLGLSSVEASADTECDPLYLGEAYMLDWVRQVLELKETTGVHVANLYSGHGTYSTIGLTHTDVRVRKHFRDQWICRQADTAAQLGAGIGFFAHAFSEPILQDAQWYGRALEALHEDLAHIARHAAAVGAKAASLEQMYTPHQPPWTIEGAERMLRAVMSGGATPFYLTLDLGHMNGQRHFLKPSQDQVLDWLERTKAGEACGRIWLGPDRAFGFFRKAVQGSITNREALDRIQESIHAFGHLFSSPADGDVHAWLRRFGRYSPIIHLQQSDGLSSPHWPFSEAFNRAGIIQGRAVLESLAASYSQPLEEGMPPPCGTIHLTLEPFIGTAEDKHEALENISESIRYWRRLVPRDGIRLSEALVRMKEGGS